MQEKETFLGLFEKQRTIILGLIAGTAAFFWGVIIPIQRIQVQLAQIQTQLEDSKVTLTVITNKNIEQDTKIDHNTQDILNILKNK